MTRISRLANCRTVSNPNPRFDPVITATGLMLLPFNIVLPPALTLLLGWLQRLLLRIVAANLIQTIENNNRVSD